MVGNNEQFMSEFTKSNEDTAQGNRKTMRDSLTNLSESFQDSLNFIAYKIMREDKKTSRKQNAFMGNSFNRFHRFNKMDREINAKSQKMNQIFEERLDEETRTWQEMFFTGWFKKNSKKDDLRNEELKKGLDKVRSGLTDLGIGSALSSLGNNTTSSMERQMEYIKDIRTELGLTGKQWNQLDALVDEKVFNPLNKQFNYLFSQEDKLDSINDAVQMGARDQGEILQLMPYLLKWQKLGGDMTAEDLEFMRPVNNKYGEDALDAIGDTAAKLSEDFGVSFKDLLTSLNQDNLYNELLVNSNGSAEVFKKSAKSFMGSVTLMKESFIDPEIMTGMLMDISKKSIAELNDSGMTQQLALAGISVQDLKDTIKDGDFMSATNDIIQGLGEYVEQNPDMAENIAGILGYDVDFLNQTALNHDQASDSYDKIRQSIENSEGTLDDRLFKLPISIAERTWNWFESLPFVRSIIKFIQQFEIGLDDVFYISGIIKMLPAFLKTGLADLGIGIVKGFGSFLDDMISGLGGLISKLNPFKSSAAGSKAGGLGASLTKSADDVGRTAGLLGGSSPKLLGGAVDPLYDASKFVDASYTVVDDIGKGAGSVIDDIGKVAGKSVDDVAKGASFLGKMGSKLGKALGPLGLIVGAGASVNTIAKAEDKKKAVATEAGGWIGGMAGGAGAGAALGSIAGPIGTAIGGVVGGIAGAIGGEKVAEWLYDNFDKIKEGASNVAKSIGEFFGNAWDWIVNIWTDASEWFNQKVITPVKNFFAPIVESVSLFFKQAWDRVVNVWTDASTWFNEHVITPIKDFFAPIVEWISTNIFEPVKTFFENAFYFVVGVAASMWEGVQNIWNNVTGWFMDNIWTPMTEGFELFKLAVVQKFTDAWNWIVNIWQDVTGWFRDNIWTPLFEASENFKVTVAQKFIDAWNWIVSIWQGVSTWFMDNIWNPLTTASDNFKQAVAQKFIDAWNWIKGVWEGVSSWFSNTIWSPIENFASGMWDRVSSKVSGVVDFFKSAWSGITGWFETHITGPLENIWDNTIGKITGAFEKVSGWIGGMIDKGKDIVNGSHRTGLAYAPYDGYVAELHAGEKIAYSNGEMSGSVPYDGVRVTLNRGDRVLTAYQSREMDNYGVDTAYDVASAYSAYNGDNFIGEMGGEYIKDMNSYFDKVSSLVKVSVAKPSEGDNSESSNSNTSNSLVNAARSFKGARYVWGGKDFPNLDCSGFVSSAFEKIGLVDKNYKYNNNAQAIRNQSNSLSKSSANVGDLAFLVEGNEATHIGIISGKNANGKHTMLHSTTQYNGYVEESGTDYWNAWGRFKKMGSSGSGTTGSPKGNSSQVDFIQSVAPGAVKSRKNGSTWPSVTMSQAILESGWGKSSLAQKAKNLFGIKTGSSWGGKSVSMPTTEYSNGVPYSTTANFRAYDSFSDSIIDHGNLLKNNQRYKNVLSASNYKLATQALKDAGYATDPNYPSSLNNLIETYGLSSYDDSNLADISVGENATDSKTPDVTINVENKELVKTLRWQVAELTKAYANSGKSNKSTTKTTRDLASIYNYT